MSHPSHFIEGLWIEGIGEKFTSTDPATEELIFEGRSATSEEVDLAVTAASNAFREWASRSVAERVRYLQAFREQLTEHKHDLAETISRDTGKPLWEAITEVDAMVGKVGLSQEAYQLRCGIFETEVGPSLAVTRFRPHGIVAVFGPFNFPGHLPNGHIVPALLAGNTVVFKPSEQAPLVAQRTVELWEQAGLPNGVLNMVQGGRETATALAADARLAGLFFTGSVEVGRSLHKQFAGYPEKILALEMGGNNPLVVHEISDFAAAAYLTIQSAFITAGQRCTCARRLIVPLGKEGDSFISSLVSMMGQIRVGRYSDIPEPFMGPVISEMAADKLLRAQSALRTRGGATLVEMKRLDRLGYFLSPGLIDVTAVSNRTDDELFGPIVQLIRVTDFDAAVREANNTVFGLAAGLLSDNRELYDRFISGIRAGVINWNRQTTGATGKMPFGGVGASGNHRPSGYFAADYCSYPVASMETDRAVMPETLTPGIEL
ncbi:MAG TPA: succinylglutamate-semialdehyde dehydrogenase [Desulfomonilaceae bacterium]|nr:succinylglutamate-semialdehyde dehydrogenase [Desulfomonilaceae bacterium]